jgi:hypothetical protein
MLLTDRTPPDADPVRFDQSNTKPELDGTG